MEQIILVALILIFLLTFIIYYTNYHKYKNISTKEKTGYDAALEVLRKYDLDNYIIEKRGNFTDNYNYNKKVIKLSSLVFHDNNIYSVAMGYFIAYQAVLDKENNLLFKLKKMFEPLYYFLMAAFYVLVILLALTRFELIYLIVILSLGLIYQLVFLKINLDIIKKAKKEFIKKDEELSSAIDSLYLLDISFGVLYIRALIDKIIDLSKK